MTYEKFKKDFFVRQRFGEYSDEFRDVLKQILSAFQLSSFISDRDNYFMGESKEDILIGYKVESDLFLITDKVFDDLLQYIKPQDRLKIMSFCYTKFWEFEITDNHMELCCDEKEMKSFLENEGELERLSDEYYDGQTGVVFKKNNCRIEPEYIPLVFQGIDCNVTFKNAMKLY